MVAPFYCELSEKHPTLMFLTIDVDELTVSDDATVIWSDATGNHAMRIFAAGSFGWITCDYAVMSIQEVFFLILFVINLMNVGFIFLQNSSFFLGLHNSSYIVVYLVSGIQRIVGYQSNTNLRLSKRRTAD